MWSTQALWGFLLNCWPGVCDGVYSTIIYSYGHHKHRVSHQTHKGFWKDCPLICIAFALQHMLSHFPWQTITLEVRIRYTQVLAFIQLVKNAFTPQRMTLNQLHETSTMLAQKWTHRSVIRWCWALNQLQLGYSIGTGISVIFWRGH